METHGLSSAPQATLAKFASEYEGPFTIISVFDNSNFSKEGSTVTVNADQARYYNRKDFSEHLN